MDSNGETNDSSNTLTWSVETSDDGGKFNINGMTGALTFKNSPDFETPTDVGDTAMNNTYVVTVKVTDNGIDGNRASTASDTHTFTITVTNVNEVPTIDSGPSSFSKNENTPTTEVSATYLGSDVDADDNPANLVWTLRGEDANDFTIAKNTDNEAELKFAAVPNFEAPTDDDDNDGVDGNNVYEVTIRVTDDSGGFAQQAVTITVNDLNETPVISGAATENFAEIEYNVDTTPDLLEIGEYTFTDDDGDTVTWDVSGTDEDSFRHQLNRFPVVQLQAEL